MPALGMTQDTGEILSWHFELGAIVQADDILFEVETDKTTVEVEAGSAGVIVEVRAAAGEAVPVGSVIAVIDSDESAVPVESASAPDEAQKSSAEEAPIAQAGNVASSGAESATSSSQEASPAAESSATKPAPKKAPGSVQSRRALAPATTRPGGKILASPKARLSARDKGVSLEQMAASGIDQPIQYVDVQNYIPGATAGSITQSLLQARVEHTAYKEFLEWADKQTDTPAISGAVWSLFASSAWRYSCASEPTADVSIELEQWSDREADMFTINADRVGLLNIVPSEADDYVDMVVRDMTGTPLTHYQSPHEPAYPSLTVVEEGSGHLNLSLRFDETEMSLDCAISLLNRICQLVEQPLRHLL